MISFLRELVWAAAHMDRIHADQADHAKLGNGFPELAVAVLFCVWVNCHGKMSFAFQDIFYQVGQHVLRTELDKNTPALGIDGLDLIFEADRVKDMLARLRRISSGSSPYIFPLVLE